MVQEEENKLPTHIITDWNYFLKHVNQKRFHIKSCFDMEDWRDNTAYRLRISHIYDPSHFWVVSKESEVDALHKYLYYFYSKYKLHYKIPQNHFKINMYCITYTEGAFYRSILVNIPIATTNGSWAYMFLIDFGFMAKVSIDEVYFMTTQMYTVPQFAIRATLSGMGPAYSTTWSADVVSKFNHLVCNKILSCRVTKKNYANKTLYLVLGEYNWNTRYFDSINDFLITKGLAKPMSILNIRDMKREKKRTKRGKRIRVPFIFPTFNEIETNAHLDIVLTNKLVEELS